MDEREIASLPGEYSVDSLLVTSAPNVRYLSGFTTPSDGRVLLSPAGNQLLTDGRYQAQAAEESRLEVELRRDWLPWVAEQVGSGSLGIEADDLSVAQYQELGRSLGREPVPLFGVLERERARKRPAELELLREAARIGDLAFEAALAVIGAGVSEVDVALEIERVMRRQGAEGASFDTVVASGTRSAMPHGVASAKRIESGELVTLDLGARVGGYHGDMTRTVAVGAVDEEMQRMHAAVLAALEAALGALQPGVSGRELDSVARSELARHGLEDYFAHSLGHGVGLHIHEAPKLSQSSEDVLEPGMTVTVEPGVYIPGFAGVRIEELVLVTEQGKEILSRSPRHLISI